MGLEASGILYLLMGAGVAVAVGMAPGKQRLFRIVCALFFWPLFVPLLLSGAKGTSESLSPLAPADSLAGAIAQADAELQSALDSLAGWAGYVLEREKERIRELRTAWAVQAE